MSAQALAVPSAPQAPGQFEADPAGVWWRAAAGRQFVCGPLTVFVATSARRPRTASFLILEWRDPDGAPHQVAMHRSLAKGIELRRILLHGGLQLGTPPAAQSQLDAYVRQEAAALRKRP